MFYSFSSGTSLGEDKTTLTLLSDADGNRDTLAITSPAILQINIHGVIGDPQHLTADTIEDILLDSRAGLLKNNRVKGILIHFNTPGGAVFDSDNIYCMLKDYKAKYKVPVFGYVDGLCASGGMYIASATDKIFGSPSSIIGSVGVVSGPFLNVSDALVKLGVQARTLTEGLDKDMMNPLRPWKEGEDASLKAVIANMYDRFVEVVISGRPRMDKEKLIHVYGAQIFDGTKAEQFGYIDHAMSSRNEALRALLNEAHIDTTKPYQVVSLTPRKGILSQLFDNKTAGLLSGQIVHRFDLGQSKLRDPFAYLYIAE